MKSIVLKKPALALALSLSLVATLPSFASTTPTINQILTNNGLTQAKSIEPTAIKGLLKVVPEGFLPVLMSDDGRFIIEGDIENNPSPAVSIDPALLQHGTVGTAVNDAYKQALLANMRTLKHMNEDTAFFYSSIKGLLWGVTGTNGVPFLVSADGRYFINGDVLTIKNGKITGLDENFEHAKNRHVLATLDQNTLTIYPAKNQKAVLYVATDINCPYCRLFHGKISEYNAKGITIKTIAYPVYDASPEPMRQIWCETDNAKRAVLLNSAMKGIRPKNQCQGDTNHMSHNIKHAKALAVMATPMIYKDTGELFEGDFRGDELLRFVNLK